MSLNPALLEFFEDTVTIEPFSSQTGAQVVSYGGAVTYRAVMQRNSVRTLGRDNREVTSDVQVILPERVFVDTRSRITLPTGFVPSQPPIIGVQPVKFQDMDSTLVLC